VTTTTIVVVVKQLKIERTGGVIKPADANGWSGRTKGENGRGWWEKENKRERERERERERVRERGASSPFQKSAATAGNIGEIC